MHKNILKLAYSVFLASILAGCGSSGSDGGTTSTKNVSKGEITLKSPGSITVNRSIYSTDSGAEIVTEDSSSAETALSEGMVVTIRSEDGMVEEIEYDEEMEGPIADAPTGTAPDLSFPVLGTTVTVNVDTVYGGTYTPGAIAMHDVVEISGFYQMDGSLLATYIEMNGVHPANNEVEIRGVITGLTADQFTIGGATIKYDASTTLEGFSAGLADGIYVEVEGRLEDGSFTIIIASEIENETEDEGSEVEVEGIVSGYISDADFMVNGTKVDASGATLSPGLVITDGVMVEAEGAIVEGVLVATQVEEHS